MKKILFTLLAICSVTFAISDLPNQQATTDINFWNPVLAKTWKGMIDRSITPYENGVGGGLIHRPKSEYPGDAVSESVGYGMLVALYADDQATFNKIFSAANKNLWNGCFYDWHLLPSGKKEDGAATDAEEDIILSLIFAQKLVDVGLWVPFTYTFSSQQMSSMCSDQTSNTETTQERNYLDHARFMMNSMWATAQITKSGILAPGAGWGGESFVNAGYFSPAWYKIFAKYDTKHDWNLVADRSYAIISNSPGYGIGLVPDWMTPAGKSAGSLGYNAYFSGEAFFKDAIRVLWRVAIDAVWFNDERAIEFLTNALTFIKKNGGAPASNFFQMDGSLLPEDDVWKDLNGSKITRPRREHSPLTIAMWSTAATAVGTQEDRQSFSNEMKKFYDTDADYFGLAVDPSGFGEDTLHNEMYFEQFLAWFGMSLMTGVFCNMEQIIDSLVEVSATAPVTVIDENGNAITKSPIHTALFKIYNSDNSEIATIGKKPNAYLSDNTIQVSHNGSSLTFFFAGTTKNSAVSWTIYNTKGKIVARMQGNNSSWNASGYKGTFFVKATDLNNHSTFKKFYLH